MVRLYCALILLVSCLSIPVRLLAADTGQAPSPPDTPAGPAAPPARVEKPSSDMFGGLPFLPVPEIDVDPNSGTTLGLIPTRLSTDETGAIRKIIAPDVIHNPYFGWGARARIFSYPTEDTHWSIVAGGKQRVESEFDAMLETGRLRNEPWSFTAETVYDRNGTPRFYGFGNDSQEYTQTVYTNQQIFFRLIAGWNITHRWQLAYMIMPRKVKILGAQLKGIPSLTDRLYWDNFRGLRGVGVTHEILNRLILTYDSRDDVTVPTHGAYVVTYGGMAGRGSFDASLFTEAGLDARGYWTQGDATVAAHVGLRYMPSTRNAPFWALSALGGDVAMLGESEPLRGYGTGRFYDRNSFIMNLEYRLQIYSVDFSGTHIDLQFTPFVDGGRVFKDSSTLPLSSLHLVGGIGFRAIARPSVVGYLDFGKGSEGVAIFTGINYPF